MPPLRPECHGQRQTEDHREVAARRVHVGDKRADAVAGARVLSQSCRRHQPEPEHEARCPRGGGRQGQGRGQLLGQPRTLAEQRDGRGRDRKPFEQARTIDEPQAIAHQVGAVVVVNHDIQRPSELASIGRELPREAADRAHDAADQQPADRGRQARTAAVVLRTQQPSRQEREHERLADPEGTEAGELGQELAERRGRGDREQTGRR